MKITILAIGKKHDPKLLDAIEDYTQRLGHYCTFSWKLIEAKLTSGMSPDEIKDRESQLLLETLVPEDIVILLDERGESLDTPALASQLQNYMNRGTKQIIFVIGGAYGVNQVLATRADFTLSLSKLVFPHQLVRLILVEQLYRAHTLLAGEKYHHS